MKKGWMAVAMLMVSMGLVLTGCPGKSNPTTPASGGNTAPTPTNASPTNSPTITPTSCVPTGVYFQAQLNHELQLNGAKDFQLGVYLDVNGEPQTTAGVTLSGPGVGTVTLPFGAIDSSFFGCPSAFYSLSINNPTAAYLAGQTYTLTLATTAGAVTTSVVVPGGITVNSAGTTVSWSSSNLVYAELLGPSNNFVYCQGCPSGTALVSPLSIPASFYTTPGVYSMNVRAAAQVTPTGAAAGSLLFWTDSAQIPVYYGVNSPTPTSTPTSTFSPTLSPTPTFSFTPTLTPSLTPSLTPTITLTPTATPTVGSIVWGSAFVESEYPGGFYVQLALQVNGQPVSTAGVTLDGSFPGAPIVLGYAGPTTISGNVFAGYGFSAAGPTYQLGSDYTLSTTAFGKKSYITFQDPGSSYSYSVDSKGAVTQVGWQYSSPGEVTVRLMPADTVTYDSGITPLTPPLAIPVSAYGGETAGAVYQVTAYTDKQYGYVVNASFLSGSHFEDQSYVYDSVTIHGATPVPTATPTATPAGYLTQWGSAGTGRGQFGRPQGINFDSAGNLWVTDLDNSRLQELPAGLDGSVAGNWITIGGTASGAGPGQFADPQGVAGDLFDGNIYVADTFNDRIEELPYGSSATVPSNWLTFGFSGTGAGQFNSPTGVAVDPAVGFLWVTDYSNNRVQKIVYGADPTVGTNWSITGGTAPGTAPGQFNAPKGIFVDNQEYTWVADSGNNRIQKTNGGGSWTTLGGTASGSAPGQFNAPQEVTVDSNGNLFVADTGNNRIQKIAFGKDPTVSGNWTVIGGPGSGAGQFSTPVGVAVDASGKLYVADSVNDRIEIFAP